MDNALTISVVVETPHQPAWITDLIGRLDAHKSMRVIPVVLCPGDQPVSAPGKTRSWACELACHKILRFIDTPKYQQNPWDTSTIDHEHIVTDDAQNSSQRLQAHAAIMQADVILNLTSASLPATLTSGSKAPIWCAHAETLKARVENALLLHAPLFWLHLWSESAATGHVDVIASHALPRQSYSLRDLERAAFSSLPAVFESRLNWLANGAELEHQESGNLADMAFCASQEYQQAKSQALREADNHYLPTYRSDPATLYRAIAVAIRQTIERVVSHVWYEQWQLAIFTGHGKNKSLLSDLLNTPVEQYTELKSSEKTWWADPHLFEHKGKTWVFFEEMSINSSRGHVSVASLNAQGEVGDVIRVLEDEKHLSYPYVFAQGSDVYMLPETASQRRVSLYRAKDFPHTWHPPKVILEDVDLADSTLHFSDNRWWMFTNSQSAKCVDERDELRLYYADQPEGPWTAHPMNPVVTGVDRARMAGPLLRDGSLLYRVSQYGAYRYGYGVNMNRIDRLDINHYQETIVGRILPTSGTRWLGCHSIGHLNGITVLDRVKRRKR